MTNPDTQSQCPLINHSVSIRSLPAGSNVASHFLPPEYQGVTLNNQGDPILNLQRPPGVTNDSQRASLNALADLNRLRYQQSLDPQISSRIAAYEMAFRMQIITLA